MGKSLQPDTDIYGSMIDFVAVGGCIRLIVLVADIDYYDANNERYNPDPPPKNLAICAQFHVFAFTLSGGVIRREEVCPLPALYRTTSVVDDEGMGGG